MASPMVPDSPDLMLCAMCREQGTKKCTGCHEIHYCSKICQKRDWLIHKLVCKTFKDFSEDQRPGPDYYRAILFPEDGEQPHFIWLEFRDNPCRSGETENNHVAAHGVHTDCAKKAAVLGDFFERPGELVDLPSPVGLFRQYRNPVLNQELRRKIQTTSSFRSAQFHDALTNHEVNRSLLKIDKELQDVWYGNTIACGHHCVTGQPQAEEIFDLVPMEFRHVVDMLRFYHDIRKREIQEQVDGPTTMGARIACAADTRLLFHKGVNTLPVSKSLCDVESDVLAPVMDRIEIPLVFRQLPLSLTWRDRGVGIPELNTVGTNPYLSFLNPDLPLCSDRHSIGSAIAVRKDGKPLSETHMRAFIEYGRSKTCVCGYHDCPCAGSASCSKEDFLAWYADWCLNVQLTSGGVLGSDPSPYDL